MDITSPSYEEKHHHVLHSLPFFGTDAQVRSIRVKLAKTPQFQRWHVLETKARQLHVTATDNLPCFEAMLRASTLVAEELAKADLAMLCVLHDLIEEELE